MIKNQSIEPTNRTLESSLLARSCVAAAWSLDMSPSNTIRQNVAVSNVSIISLFKDVFTKCPQNTSF